MNIAILGYGLMGRLCALALADVARLHIVSSEAEHEQSGAGWKAAAMLAPIAESVHTDSALVDMGWDALSLWPRFLEKLDGKVFFQQVGTLVVAHQQDESLLQQFRQRIALVELRRVKSLRRQELQSLEPELAGRFQHGLFLEEEGHIDNHGLFHAIDRHLAKRNVAFSWSQSIGNKPREFVQEAYFNQKFDWVIDCRGIGAKAQWPNLRGVRGEVVRVHAPEVVLNRPVRLMHPRYPLYIVPKPGNQYVLGATQIESEDEGAIRVRSCLELLSAAYSLHPGFGEARIIRAEAGLRPALIDNNPRLRIESGFMAVNGLYRHGFMLGPVFAQMISHMVKGDELGGLAKYEQQFVQAG